MKKLIIWTAVAARLRTVPMLHVITVMYGKERDPGGDYHHAYHVESSFTTEEQIKYAGTAVAYLDLLVLGEPVGIDATPTVPFAKRLEEKFLAQTGKRKRFYDAFTEAMEDELTEFQKRYPNLMPALDAVYRAGGGVGTLFAAYNGRSFLKQAIAGESLVPSPMRQEYKGHKFDHSHFVMRHPQIAAMLAGWPVNYEVWCTGEPLANTLLEQSIQAAKNLAKIPDVRKGYDSYYDTHGREPDLGTVRNDMTIYVQKLLEETQKAQEIGNPDAAQQEV